MLNNDKNYYQQILIIDQRIYFHNSRKLRSNHQNNCKIKGNTKNERSTYSETVKFNIFSSI